jgi:hypothetical protein
VSAHGPSPHALEQIKRVLRNSNVLRASVPLTFVADAPIKPLDEQLEEIRAQLGWVRDYL